MTTPRFTRYKKETFGGWDLEFPNWFVSWEWEKSEKYGYEWEFSIKKLNHTYNDSRLPDILFSVSSCETFTWLPTKVSCNTAYKEFSIFGVTLGVLI